MSPRGRARIAPRCSEPSAGPAPAPSLRRAEGVLLLAVAGRSRPRRRIGLRALGATILLLDPGVDLLAVHLDFRWRLDAQLDLSGANLEHGNLHRITDPDVLS